MPNSRCKIFWHSSSDPILVSSRLPLLVTINFISDSVIRPSAVAREQIRFCVNDDSGEV